MLLEMNESESGQVEEKVYVALPERLKDGKNTLSWVLNHFSNGAKIIITHVHIPPQMIPMSKHSYQFIFLTKASTEDVIYKS